MTRQRATKRISLNRWSPSNAEHSHILEFQQEATDDGIISSPREYFSSFFDSDILNLIVEQSNLYSIQQNANKPLKLTKDELEKWIGLVIYFSMSKLPNTRMHWAKKLSPLTDYAGECMSRDRFETIKRFLHIADNSREVSKGNNGYDPLFKVRPLIDHLRPKFQALPRTQCLSIDEQVVPFNKRSRLKQYIPNKPKKWGYKLFILASDQGFMYDFIPYTGKIDPVNNPNIPDLKPNSNAVLHLAENIPSNRNHQLCFGNWFTSVPLLVHLAGREIWCCGTVRLSRLQGLPKSKDQDKRLMKMGRGAFEEKQQRHDAVDITLVRWFDNKIVNMISTFAKANPTSTVCRFDKKRKIQVAVTLPDIVARYNKSMGGVDLADQLISLYRINMKSKKSYHRLIFHFLDMALVNAWLLYRKDARSLSVLEKDIMSLASFRLSVGFSLTKAGKISPNKRGRPSTKSVGDAKRHRSSAPSTDVQLDKIGHCPLYKKNRNRCKNGSCKGRTHLFCNKCNVNLCIEKNKNCWAKYHGFD